MIISGSFSVMPLPKTLCPLQTALTAGIMLSKSCLIIYPFAPRDIALIIYSSSLKVVRYKIFASLCFLTISVPASRPVIPAILISIRRTSGTNSSYSFIASFPLLPVPTTSISLSDERIVFKLIATRLSSSTTSTFIGLYSFHYFISFLGFGILTNTLKPLPLTKLAWPPSFSARRRIFSRPIPSPGLISTSV